MSIPNPIINNTPSLITTTTTNQQIPVPILTPNLSDTMIKRLQQLPTIIEGMYSTDLLRVAVSSEALRKILSIERRPPIEEVIQTGIVPRLVELLHVENVTEEIRLECCWAVTNLASGTSAQTKSVVDAGAVPFLVDLLKSSNMDVREQAAHALGNIAGDSVEFRNVVLESGGLPLLVALLTTPDVKLSVIRNSTWSLSNFVRFAPPPSMDNILIAIQAFAHVLRLPQPDDDAFADAFWGLSYITSVQGQCPEQVTERIHNVVKADGIVQRVVELVELIGHQNDQVRTPALRTLCNIATSKDSSDVQAIIDVGCLTRLFPILAAAGVRIHTIKDACTTVGNIVHHGNHNQIDAVITVNIIPELVKLMDHGDIDVKSQALIATVNVIVFGSKEQVENIINNHDRIISILCECVRAERHIGDEKILMNSLDGLHSILDKNVLVKKNLVLVRFSSGEEEYDDVDKNQDDDDELVSLSVIMDKYQIPKQIEQIQLNNKLSEELRKKALHLMEIHFCQFVIQPKSAGMFI
jgi:importin subunit alpha-1